MLSYLPFLLRPTQMAVAIHCIRDMSHIIVRHYSALAIADR